LRGTSVSNFRVRNAPSSDNAELPTLLVMISGKKEKRKGKR